MVRFFPLFTFSSLGDFRSSSLRLQVLQIDQDRIILYERKLRKFSNVDPLQEQN